MESAMLPATLLKRKGLFKVVNLAEANIRMNLMMSSSSVHTGGFYSDFGKCVLPMMNKLSFLIFC